MRSARQFWLTVTGLVGIWLGSLTAMLKHSRRGRTGQEKNHD